MAFVPIPLALHITLQGTATDPIAGLLNEVTTLHLASASLIEGFPYADVPHMGMSVVTIAHGDQDAAASAAEGIARKVWERRHSLTARLPSPDAALREAAQTATPTLVLDVGDNIGGGSTADSTVLLHEARRLGVKCLFQTLCDPDAVGTCVRVGIGRSVTIEVGGVRPGSPAPPFGLSGRVAAISDGQYEDPTPTHGGNRFFEQGPTAVLETTDGFTLMLTSLPVMNNSLRQLSHIGVDPTGFSVIIAKGVNAPKAAYDTVVDRMIYADTPGVTAANVRHLGYEECHSVFPLEDFAWEPMAHPGARST
jgi:microcystin degradation protein MlrC